MYPEGQAKEQTKNYWEAEQTGLPRGAHQAGKNEEPFVVQRSWAQWWWSCDSVGENTEGPCEQLVNVRGLKGRRKGRGERAKLA